MTDPLRELLAYCRDRATTRYTESGEGRQIAQVVADRLQEIVDAPPEPPRCEVPGQLSIADVADA